MEEPGDIIPVEEEDHLRRRKVLFLSRRTFRWPDLYGSLWSPCRKTLEARSVRCLSCMASCGCPSRCQRAYRRCYGSSLAVVDMGAHARRLGLQPILREAGHPAQDVSAARAPLS